MSRASAVPAPALATRSRATTGQANALVNRGDLR